MLAPVTAKSPNLPGSTDSNLGTIHSALVPFSQPPALLAHLPAYFCPDAAKGVAEELLLGGPN